ncbi:MAG: phage tail tape measure protein [Betaproteobacteria bacterium]|nr:phage tail tape measure protein [Betaproteobacteria bacterium]
MANELALSFTFGASVGAALSAFNNLKGTMGKVADVTKNLKKEHKELGDKIAGMIQKQQGATSYIAHLTQQYEKQKTMLDKLRKSTEALGKSQAAIAANEQHRQKLRGQIMETAALAFAVVKPLQVGFEFDATMSRASAWTQLDRQSDAMKSFEARIRSVAQTSSYAAGEVAKAGLNMVSSLFNPEQAEAMLLPTARLARIGDMGVDQVAEMASDLLSAWKIPASDFERVSDMMVQTAIDTNTNINKLFDSLKSVAPTAKQLGLSEESAIALTGLLGNAGFHGTEAAGQMKLFMNKLTGSDKLKKMGIKVMDKAGNFLGIDEIFKKLNEKTKGMGDAKRAAFFKDIFGGKGGVGAEIIAKLAESGFTEQLERIRDSAGIAEKTAAAMTNNLTGDLQQLKAAFTEIFTTFAMSEDAPLRELLQSIIPLVRQFAEWLKEYPNLTKGLAVLLTGLIGLKVGFLGISYGASMAYGSILHFVKIGRMIKAAYLMTKIQGMATVFPKIAAGLTWLGTAFSWLGGILLSHPILAIVTAIAVAGLMIYQYWDKIAPFFQSIWQTIKDVFSGGIESVAALIINWSPPGLFYRYLIAPIASVFGVDLPETLSSCMTKIGAALWGVLATLIDWSPLGLIYEYFFAPLVAPILSLFGVELPETLSGCIAAIGSALWDGFIALINGLASFFYEGVKFMIAPIVLLFDVAASAIGNMLSRFWQEIKAAFTGGLSGVAELLLNWSPLGLFYRSFAELLSWFGIELPGKFTDVGRMLIDGLIGGITARFNAIKETMGALGETLKNKVKGVLGISSPSKVFMEIGGFTMLGLEQGLANAAARPLAMMKRYAGAMAAAGTLAVAPMATALPQLPAAALMVSPALSALPQLPIALPDARPVRRPQEPLRAGVYQTRPGAAAFADAMAGPINITINAAPGMDERKLADLVARKIKEIERDKAARMRSRLVDAD